MSVSLQKFCEADGQSMAHVCPVLCKGIPCKGIGNTMFSQASVTLPRVQFITGELSIGPPWTSFLLFLVILRACLAIVRGGFLSKKNFSVVARGCIRGNRYVNS